jgi:dephospho-CoA kinase
VLRIGLTGGIGSGKSTVAARFAELGAVVVDGDRIAREVVEVGSPGLARLIERFGAGVLAADGSLDRPKLAELVFADGEARTALNAIVHPLVAQRGAELSAVAAKSGAVAVVHDIPLLVENNLAGGFDVVVVVQAPLDVRLRRLAARGLDEAAALARIATQATDEQRRAAADLLLDNSGSEAELNAQVDAAWAGLLSGSGHGG